MYITINDIRKLLSKENVAEEPGIFIEYMGEVYEPTSIDVDDDGDIIIII